MAAGNKVKEAADAARTDVMDIAGLGFVLDGTPTTILAFDQAAAQTLITRYNDNLKTFDKSITDLNTAVDTGNKESEKKESSEKLAMAIPAIVGAVISGLLFFWAKAGKNIDQCLKDAKMGVARGSLAPLAGLVITALTFIFADKLGGRYFISWGLVLFGGIFFIRSIVEYFKVRSAVKKSA